MSRAPVPPTFGGESFSCAHCGALADQHWFKVIPEHFQKDKKPSVCTAQMAADLRKTLKNANRDAEDFDERKQTSLLSFLDRFDKNEVTYLVNRHSVSSTWEMINLNLSQCHSCKGFTIWVGERIVYPSHDVAILPHDDMPADIKPDFIEAAEIVDSSPRSAAALLRLAIQKLMPHLDEDGDNLNKSIGNLVKKGLDKRVQQALDVVRVTGNNAVHPGELDLKDDKATALQLFSLVNIIVQSTISAKAQIEAMYANLPPGALKAIEKRDS
ncbi:DUF4145 domain-containing protein [Bradyrhizobium sp. BRP22]|uniref:DUF4145 domain-containing protein n=1 Tax=Bradyrhizobium sp. BRP22 TaxID=2793821 RepID=UPI001CD36735|nr:DUF4145 domain-containing protein [Bradyrhizobium sp. BRP22]MCA1457761.1 DUF4145 domain-containing protein [Bradyrhizobium sp. BRP22]